MRLRLFFAALLFVLPLPATANPDAPAQVFQAYQAALLAGDGAGAAELVTQNSKDLYRSYAVQALELNRTDLEALHVVDRMTVLLLRHSLGRDALTQMSGADIIAYAVEQGWIDREGTAAIRLGNYQTNGDLATAALLQPNGSPTPFKVEFLKEAGLWRLNVAKMLELARFGVEAAIQQTGMSEEEFLVFLLEFSTGRKPGPEIWEPPA